MDTPGLNHVVMTVSDLKQSRQFYGDVLGFDIQGEPGAGGDVFYFVTGGVSIWFVAHEQVPAGDRFSEFRVGLDHLAFTAPSEEALQALVDRLKAAGAETTEVKTFVTGNKYVVFRDPDNVQIGYWMD